MTNEGDDDEPKAEEDFGIWDHFIHGLGPDHDPPPPPDPNAVKGAKVGVVLGTLLDGLGRIAMFLIGAIALVWFAMFVSERLAKHSIQNPSEEQKAAGDEAQEAVRELHVECSWPLATFPKCVADLTESQPADDGADYDLQAQQRMAMWAEGLFWLTCAGLGASVIGIYFVYANLVATRRIGENENKAYVHTTGATLNVFTRRGLFAHIDHTVRVTAANVGQTPAVRVNAAAKIWVEEGPFASTRKVDPLHLELDQSDNADVIVPEAPITLRFKLAKGAYRPLEQGDEEPVEGLLGTCDRVVVRGSVFYSDVFQSRYRTDFHYEFNGPSHTRQHHMLPVVGNLRMFEELPKRPITGPLIKLALRWIERRQNKRA